MEIATRRSAHAEALRQRWSEREQWTRERFRERAALSGPRRHRVEEQIVLGHLDLVDGLVRRLAPRYRDLGDLRQVGCVGLINAVHRYDPARGDAFVPYAVPTISGEVKRYLRDQGWFVRPPRSVQELRAAAVHAMPDLAQQLRHEPSAGELAAYLHASPHAVQEAIATPTSLHPISLDDHGDDESSPDAMLGTLDARLECADTRLLVRRAIATLSPRERRIVYLRFFEERTQREIAVDIGVTQMQVSRLLTAILFRLRACLTPPREAPEDGAELDVS